MSIFNFRDALRVGIKRDSDVPANSLAFDQFFGMRPTEYGAKNFKTIDIPFSSSYMLQQELTRDGFPFPQLIRMNEITLLAYEGKLYEATEASGSTWTVSQISIYDWTTYDYATDTADPGTIPTGTWQWHSADFYGSWMLFSPVCTIFKFAFSDKVFVQTDVTIRTGAAWKEGRAVYGGFGPDMFDLADWPTLINGMDTNAPTEVQALSTYAAAGGNWVWWSTIGGGDLMWLFDLDFMKYASLASSPDMGYSDDYQYFLDLWKQNLSGIRPMPWQGNVLKVLPLGEHMMVYGEDGIAALAGTDFIGMRSVVGWPHGRGIGNPGAAGGTEHEHLVVDDSGALWRITPELRAEKLDYLHETTADSNSWEQMIVTYDRHEDEYHLGSSVGNSWLLTRTGFCEEPYVWGSIVESDEGGTVGMRNKSIPSEDVVKLTTVKFYAPTGRKLDELTHVFLKSEDATGWTVKVDYRFDQGGSWTRTSGYTPGKRGVARVKVPGVEFRLYLEHSDRSTAGSLDDIELEFREGGKLSLRNAGV